MTLIEFVDARLAEDDKTAREAKEIPSDPDGLTWHWVDADADTPVDLADWDSGALTLVSDPIRRRPDQVEAWPAILAWWVTDITAGTARHIARHDPSRVLADVAARRQMLARCQTALASGEPQLVRFAELMLRDLARPYADHPDYREEWRR